ncbi:uncharacterized protein LOC110229447 [Arabidopsis lyrata subsp. lyrata]|uniref:uncharacterized protein LOC110229447 n=1 Tax=Arabidopsis lyrata subsp. lyrata TaxID=81972 RepID=UPI000A29AA33|nr:uncharacterized protein LOC110229447 [Arabidopsis lyrata subsp. lyrata]|eukprot:XP_020885318.1 uncharacterized protein LOC110229447 [Arabidopsis lyrata subsp. lyrata]
MPSLLVQKFHPHDCFSFCFSSSRFKIWSPSFCFVQIENSSRVVNYLLRRRRINEKNEEESEPSVFKTCDVDDIFGPHGLVVNDRAKPQI